MARNLVSPGISFTEFDQSQVPQAATQIGPAIIGVSQNGPMFDPTEINDYSGEYAPLFGGLNKNYYMPYAVKNYLENGSNALVLRVGGYSSTRASKDEGFIIPASASWLNIQAAADGLSSTTAQVSATSVPFALLRKRSGASVTTVSAAAASVNGVINGTVTVDGTAYTFTPSTIERYFTRDPQTVPSSPACSGLYLDVLYYSQANNGSADPTPTLSDLTFAAFATTNVPVLNGSAVQGAYSTAQTPWIVSEPDGDSNVTNLFRFHTLQSGYAANHQCKVSIDNITRKTDILGNSYYQFDVLVRKVDDVDKNGMVLFERFSSCNLIESSNNYIVKKIGDSYRTFSSATNTITRNGTGPNMSKFIRVEMNEGFDWRSRPSGFGALPSINSTSDAVQAYPHRNLKINQASGSITYNSKMFFGFEGNGYGIEAVIQPYGDNDSATDKGILLYDRGALGLSTSADEITGVTGGSLANTYHILPIYPDKTTMDTVFNGSGIVAGGLSFKFTVPFYGGHDGYARSETNETLLTTLSAEFVSATELLKNKDIYKFNDVVIPGTIASYAAHSSIIEAGIDLCEERGDCFYIADMFAVTATDAAAPDNTSVDGFDTNYAGTYWPWHKRWDNENKDYVWLPPSILALERYAYNDRVAYPWYAIAGKNRGVGKNLVELRYQLTQTQRDTLYENRINPIASFKDTEGALWGQKTLQKESSALDRINVRRLLITAKREIEVIGLRYLFEASTEGVWSRMTAEINKILTGIKTNNGLVEFYVQIDSSTNTPDVIDRNELVGKIWIKPTKTIEKMYFDFTITSQGAVFNGI